MAETTDNRLSLLIQRIENLETEKKDISDSIKDVYTEAKSVGYDVKAMRQVVRLRRKDKNERMQEEMMLETYKAALGLE